MKTELAGIFYRVGMGVFANALSNPAIEKENPRKRGGAGGGGGFRYRNEGLPDSRQENIHPPFEQRKKKGSPCGKKKDS